LLLAGGLFVGGCLSLIRARPSAPGATGCEHDARPGAYRSLGAVYLLGASSALVVSPCCTPVVAGIVAVAAATGKPVVGCALLIAYALGHAVPLIAAGTLSRVAHRLIPSTIGGQAPAIVGAILMMALGAYYGMLA
jgi:cytochrome c biogenesis protein CcdA